jgi:DNA-binding transcriptional LysR family regulator
MEPTRRAKDLNKFIRDGLHQTRQGIRNQFEFDPATAERTFKVRISDFMISCLLPRLCARVRADAPGVRLIVEQLPKNDEACDPGDIQLRVAARLNGGHYKIERIWRDPFVIAMRRDHPAAKLPMSFDRFLKLPYLDISSAIIDTSTLDEVLRARGVQRRASVTIPYAAGIIPILEHSDLCAILPRRWIDLYSAPRVLAKAPLPPPIENIEYAVDVVWQSGDERDGGHRWLRDVIAQEFAVLYAPMKRPPRVHRHSADKLDLRSPLRRRLEE